MVDKKEAALIAEQELEGLRALGYSSLLERVEEMEHHQVTGSSGTVYNVETMVYWDARAGRALRVIAAVDDGRGWSTFHPLSRDFILEPD